MAGVPAKTQCNLLKMKSKSTKTLCAIAKIKSQKTKKWGLLSNPTHLFTLLIRNK
jgi:hypothetical protein